MRDWLIFSMLISQHYIVLRLENNLETSNFHMHVINRVMEFEFEVKQVNFYWPIIIQVKLLVLKVFVIEFYKSIVTNQD